MKKYYTLLAIAALSLSIFACEKEAATPAQPDSLAPLTPQQKLDELALPLILFQYSYINLESGEETGWFIDRSGDVLAYNITRPAETAPSSENENWKEAGVSTLYNSATEIVTTLEAEELLGRVQQGLTLSTRSLSESATDEGTSWTRGFYAFIQTARKSNADSNASDDCDYQEVETFGSHVSEINIERMIIDLSGRVNRYETSDAAIGLQEWLMGLNEKL